MDFVGGNQNLRVIFISAAFLRPEVNVGLFQNNMRKFSPLRLIALRKKRRPNYLPTTITPLPHLRPSTNIRKPLSTISKKNLSLQPSSPPLSPQPLLKAGDGSPRAEVSFHFAIEVSKKWMDLQFECR
ncbi:Uncharacterized protein Fot_53800 [Forsythia ovata]|uniref:Uncharacterized protein n=1 Tax=Forsythia ovata TaxID=205694 RepID=A0ABD1PGQ6_9LAMI